MSSPPEPRLPEWREVKRRPVQGNSPNDRILRGPGCNRPKRVCADSFPATLSAGVPANRRSHRAFFRHDGIYRSDRHQNHLNLGVGCRLPLVGPRAPVKGRDGRDAPCSSSAMSSGRLFLDRVARQQSPSPLHRQIEHNMHILEPWDQGDISTLPGGRHFYFALTVSENCLTQLDRGDNISARLQAVCRSGIFSASGVDRQCAMRMN